MSEDDLSRLEHQIRRVLRIGVVLTGATLVIGLGLYFVGWPGATPLLNAGLILLMAIPVSRIIASFVDAVRRRDHLLIWSTAFVLVTMTLTLIKSMHH